jgi:meso-butanediol dehydrogenase/(S,S)-butanediol dehydrogenase/diacetyl reductase
MDLGLKGKVAIVTGGAMGMGAVISGSLIKEGANVVIADVSIDAAQKLAAKLSKDGAKAIAVKCDVSKKADADNLAAATMKEFGKIDILVNNAGVIRQARFSDELTEEIWDLEMNVNARGNYLVTQAVLPYMIAARYGKIVNASSICGKQGTPEFCSYTASKFAVTGITQTLGKELAQYNINVNAYCPGYVRTPMWEGLLAGMSKRLGRPQEEIWDEWIGTNVPLKRPQEPQDIANVVLFLSSDVSKNITGEAISVNGGTRVD